MANIRRRILKETKSPVKTDKIGAKIKLNNLLKRAKENGTEQGPLTPIEALVTISQDEWIWQAVSKEILDTLYNTLVDAENTIIKFRRHVNFLYNQIRS